MKHKLQAVGLLGVVLSSMAPTSGKPPTALVAKASTLTPQPFVAAPSTPLVYAEVVYASTPTASYISPQSASGGLGYMLGGSNCVACVRQMTGRSQNGNAGTWVASHSTPHVGDIMIFRPGQQGAGSQGHVGVVTGVHGNMVSLAHCNWGGSQTEFYSTGLFW